MRAVKDAGASRAQWRPHFGKCHHQAPYQHAARRDDGRGGVRTRASRSRSAAQRVHRHGPGAGGTGCTRNPPAQRDARGRDAPAVPRRRWRRLGGGGACQSPTTALAGGPTPLTNQCPVNSPSQKPLQGGRGQTWPHARPDARPPPQAAFHRAWAACHAPRRSPAHPPPQQLCDGKQ